MSPKVRFIARRISHLLFTAALIGAVGGAVTACAKKATEPSASVGSATGSSDTTQTPDPIEPTATVPAPTDAEAPTVSNPGPVTQTTLPKPGEFQVLVTILETGGMCAGPCGEIQTIIYSDGTWSNGLALDPNRSVTATTLAPATGQLNAETVTQLKGAWTTATAAELQALPVTQQYCPSAADGRDLTYTYRLQGTEAAVSNCTVNLGEANELLRLTSKALDEIRSQTER
jgi:hypothetical protein